MISVVPRKMLVNVSLTDETKRKRATKRTRLVMGMSKKDAMSGAKRNVMMKSIMPTMVLRIRPLWKTLFCFFSAMFLTIDVFVQRKRVENVSKMLRQMPSSPYWNGLSALTRMEK